MNDDPDYDNLQEIDNAPADRLVQVLKNKFKGSGALWMPFRSEREIIRDKDAKGKIVLNFQLAVGMLQRGFEIVNIHVTASGLIVYLLKPEHVEELIAVGNLVFRGKSRPLWAFTKECLHDFSVLIHQTIEQQEGKLITTDIWQAILHPLGESTSVTYVNHAIDGNPVGIAGTAVIAHFKGEPWIAFSRWPIALSVPGLDVQMRVPYLLFVNNADWSDRCCSCRKTVSTVHKEEKARPDGDHDCVTAPDLTVQHRKRSRAEKRRGKKVIFGSPEYKQKQMQQECQNALAKRARPASAANSPSQAAVAKKIDAKQNMLPELRVEEAITRGDHMMSDAELLGPHHDFLARGAEEMSLEEGGSYCGGAPLPPGVAPIPQITNL